MKSANIGTDISPVAVLNVSPQGFWLLVDEREHFLAFTDFPRFRGATLRQIFAIERSQGTRLYWPELEVDLDMERIQHPEKFPHVAKTN